MGIDTGEGAPRQHQDHSTKNSWYDDDVFKFNEDEAKKEAETWAKKLKDRQ